MNGDHNVMGAARQEIIKNMYTLGKMDELTFIVIDKLQQGWGRFQGGGQV